MAIPIEIDEIVPEILRRRAEHPPERALLVGISGIDAAGKGYLAHQITSALRKQGLHVAALTVDDWLNLPSIRFNPKEPGGHFYRYGIRLGEMFSSLVLPLQENRSITLEARLTRETAKEHHDFRFEFDNIDVIVLEGIFLLKREFRDLFDFSLWVDCSFSTALERALGRGQEGLSREATINAYRTIYFPAQRLHIQLDAPHVTADVVVGNDPKGLRVQGSEFRVQVFNN